jgi:hypothetical protein
MSAIRSGELLACPAAPRWAPPPPLAVVSVRTWGAATRVRAVAAEGAGKGKKRAASGITKPKPISPELREFVGGAEELPRTQAIKLVWAHIKGNNLQVNSDPLALFSLAKSICNALVRVVLFFSLSNLAVPGNTTAMFCTLLLS